jgi:hypothetical protein
MNERFPLVRMALADGQVWPRAWLTPRLHAVVVTGLAGSLRPVVRYLRRTCRDGLSEHLIVL